MIIIDIIVAVHLQGNAAVGTRPALYADTEISPVLHGALAVSGAAVFAAGCKSKYYYYTYVNGLGSVLKAALILAAFRYYHC